MKKIVVVAHDGGGAEQLSCYIKANAVDNFEIYAAGPAVNFFKKKNLTFQSIISINEIEELIKAKLPDLILTGTG